MLGSRRSCQSNAARRQPDDSRGLHVGEPGWRAEASVSAAATPGITILRGGIEAIADTAAAAEAAGFDAVWTPEFYTRSAVVTLARIASQTSRSRGGTSIAY